MSWWTRKVVVGFDYWQVISHYPLEMSELCEALAVRGHDVHVISAIDWTAGSGPQVTGPVLALVLATTGRAAALDDLTGEGAATPSSCDPTASARCRSVRQRLMKATSGTTRRS